MGTIEVLLSAIGIEAGSDPLAGVEPAAAGRTIAGAWRRYFESLCAEGPVVALIEDIHWADDPVFELIESLSTRTSGALVLLCTARPQLWELRPSWGAGVRDATVVDLPPLSDSEGRSVLEGLLAGHAPDDVVDQITARAGGNPFFTGELVRMMVEDGTLERVGTEWARTRDLPSALPDTIQRVIASRIDLLATAQKRAIQDCAVVGRVCWVGAVERLGGSEVEAHLEDLIDKGFVRERDASAIAGERELSFHHSLTRDVAYESIPRGRRREAHGLVIDWLEEATTGRDEEFAEILANHATRAEDRERVVRYAMLAGHRHRRVFAAEEAIAWYDRALAALEELPTEEGALTLFEIALSRGEACEQLGRFDEAHADYERALEAALIRPEGSRGWLESRALAALVHVLWKADRYEEGEALLPRALESARVDERRRPRGPAAAHGGLDGDRPGGLGGGRLVRPAGARRRDRGGRPRDGGVRPARPGRNGILHGPLRRGAEAGTAGRGAAPGPRAAADDPSQRVHERGRRVAARRSGSGPRRSPRPPPTARGISGIGSTRPAPARRWR